MLELQALGLVHRHNAHAADLAAARRLLLPQAGLGHRGDVTGELARRGLWRAAHVGRRQLAELGQVDQALDDIGLRGEQLLAAQSEPLDEPVDEQVGPRGVKRGGGRPVALEKVEDAVARLRRKLRGLRGGDERGHHVELAPAGDLDTAREVDRAQLHRRPGQRTHHRAGVAGVGQQPQPRQHVADLRPLEERGRPDQPMRHRALLQGHRDGLALAAHRAHEHAHRFRRDAPAGQQRFDVRCHALRLRALVGAAPERHLRSVGSGRRLLELGHGLDHCARRGKNRGAASQAALKPHDAGSWARGEERPDVGVRRCPEALYGLVGAGGGD